MVLGRRDSAIARNACRKTDHDAVQAARSARGRARRDAGGDRRAAAADDLFGVLLADRDQVVSIDRMVDALWTDRAPDASGAVGDDVRLAVACRHLGDGTSSPRVPGTASSERSAHATPTSSRRSSGAAERSLPDRALDCFDSALSACGAAIPSGSWHPSGGRSPRRRG